MVSLTDAAIKQLTESVDPTDVVRIGVKSGGCSGLSYFMSVEEQSDEDDTLVEYENLKICIDSKSAFVLADTEVDYVETIASSGFKFDNKRATNTCGCGASFAQQQSCDSNTNRG